MQVIREKFLATKDGKEGSDLRIKYEDSCGRSHVLI